MQLGTFNKKDRINILICVPAMEINICYLESLSPLKSIPIYPLFSYFSFNLIYTFGRIRIASFFFCIFCEVITKEKLNYVHKAELQHAKSSQTVLYHLLFVDFLMMAILQEVIPHCAFAYL